MAEAYANRWRTIDDILGTKRLSAAVVAALSDLAESPRQRPGTGDVASYVMRAASLGTVAHGTAHGFIRQQLEKAIGRDGLQAWMNTTRVPTRRSVFASDGLKAAIADAFEIRNKTGGKDNYIGARHVIFSILSSPNNSVVLERWQLQEDLKLQFDPLKTDSALGGLLSAALEENENPEAWSQILLARGFKAAAEALQQSMMGSSLAKDSDVPGTVSLNELNTPKIIVPRKKVTRSENSKNPTPRETKKHQDHVTAAQPVEYRIQAEAIAGFLNDNPWSVPSQDIVGVDGIASALGRLVAAREFRPPLAVGIFGAWGSGKSLLMRRIHAEVDGLSRSPDTAFYDRIVQINFNAWHYVDTDLWASLAGSIFEELDAYARRDNPKSGRFLDRLTTARTLTLEAAQALASSRRATQRAEQAVKDAENVLLERRRTFALRLAGVKASANAASAAGKIWLAGDNEAREAIQSTYGRSLEEMAIMWGSPQAAVESLRRDGLIWMEAARRFGRKRTFILALLFALLCFSAPILAPIVLGWAPQLSDWLSKVQPFAAAITGLLVTVATAASAFTRKAVRARDAVIAAVEVYQKAKLEDDHQKKEGLDASRVALQAAQEEVERARAALGLALGRQAEANVAFAGETPGGRLRSFVESRAGAQGPYRTRQGLISTIRRDFLDLAALMNPEPDDTETANRRKAEEAWQSAVSSLTMEYGDNLTSAEMDLLGVGPDEPSSQRPFNRIVLYIDDLDRCPPEKVIEVLQAAHLLLAHSLFVVIVAVDIRWVTGALQNGYPELMENDDPASAGRAAALDYLEKIFQLPIWTTPVPAAEASRIVTASLGSSAQLRSWDENVEHSAPAGVDEANGSPDGRATSPERGPPPLLGNGGDVVSKPLPSSVGPRPQRLKLEPEEIKFLGLVAERLGCSPRRLVRLANTYRVARAGVSEETTRALLGGGYRGLVVLLSIAAAFPREAHQMMSHLIRSESWQAAAKLWELTLKEDATGRDCMKVLANFLDEEKLSISRDVKPFVALAQRFSFTGSEGGALVDKPEGAPSASVLST
jgi:hypothetical protein